MAAMRRLGWLLPAAALAASLAACLAAGAARAEMTTTELLAKYEGADDSSKRLLDLVASSTENGLAWSNSYLKTVRKEEELYCNTSGKALTGGDVMAILKAESDKTPAIAALPFGLGMLLALRGHFPC